MHCYSAKSQSFIVISELAEAKKFPELSKLYYIYLLNQILIYLMKFIFDIWPYKVFSNFPVSISQIFIVASSEQLANI